MRAVISDDAAADLGACPRPIDGPTTPVAGPTFIEGVVKASARQDLWLGSRSPSTAQRRGGVRAARAEGSGLLAGEWSQVVRGCHRWRRFW